jgi:hypothetical protein
MRSDSFKFQLAKIEFINEDADHPYWIVLCDIIVKKLRQQRALSPVFAANETLHLHVPTFAVTSASATSVH